MRRRKSLFRERLEVQNAQGVCRRGVLSERGDRARREELEEAAAFSEEPVHGPSLYRHSSRIVSAGFAAAARQAGLQHPSSAAAGSSTSASAKLTGSRGETP
jgi:hypothetical protein